MTEPHREDEIARLLSSLRVEEPAPEDVVRRLDEALAHEHAHPVPPVRKVSRRRRGGVVIGIAAALALGVLGLQQLLPTAQQAPTGASTSASGQAGDPLESDSETGAADMSGTLQLHSATLAGDVRAAVSRVQRMRRSEIFSQSAPTSPGPTASGLAPVPSSASASASRRMPPRKAGVNRHARRAHPASCRLPAEPPPNSFLASLDGQPALVVVPPAKDGTVVASVLTCDGTRRRFRIAAP